MAGALNTQLPGFLCFERERERERESEIEQGTGTYIVVTDAKRQIDTLYDDKDKTKEDTYVDNARHILIQKKQR